MPKQTKTPRIKRLFFDIETTPNLGLFWRSGFKLTISPDNIINERAIACIGWKWEHEDKVHCKSWNKDQDDKKLLEDFVKVMNKSDSLISHNGNRFDIKWIRTRCLYHRIPMAPNFVSLDTFATSKSKFLFNSNQLDYIAKYLGFNGKTHAPYEWWRDITIKNDRTILKKLMSYCKNDVLMLESVFKAMEPYLPPVYSIATHAHHCPRCNGKTIIHKHRTTAAGYKKTQYVCKDCGTYNTIATSRYEKGGKLK